MPYLASRQDRENSSTWPFCSDKKMSLRRLFDAFRWRTVRRSPRTKPTSMPSGSPSFDAHVVDDRVDGRGRHAARHGFVAGELEHELGARARGNRELVGLRRTHEGR